MTVKELSQLYYLNLEIERDQKKLATLESRIGVASPDLSGMPKSANSTRSKTEELAVEIVDLQAIIAAKQIQCIHERARLERYIREIPDHLTRAIFELRFMERLSWDQVAAHVGGGNSVGGVKKRCYRYLKATDGGQPPQLPARDDIPEA